jgi:hypothetical protein
MDKVKALLLAFTVAMLTVIAAHADNGTQYFQGYPVFDWKTTYTQVGNGAYEHLLTVTQRRSGNLTIYDVSCNTSNANGRISLHGPGQTHSTHFTDTTYGQQWHWNFSFHNPIQHAID